MSFDDINKWVDNYVYNNVTGIDYQEKLLTKFTVWNNLSSEQNNDYKIETVDNHNLYFNKSFLAIHIPYFFHLVQYNSNELNEFKTEFTKDQILFVVWYALTNNPFMYDDDEKTICLDKVVDRINAIEYFFEGIIPQNCMDYLTYLIQHHSDNFNFDFLLKIIKKTSLLFHKKFLSNLFQIEDTLCVKITMEFLDFIFNSSNTNYNIDFYEIELFTLTFGKNDFTINDSNYYCMFNDCFFGLINQRLSRYNNFKNCIKNKIYPSNNPNLMYMLKVILNNKLCSVDNFNNTILNCILMFYVEKFYDNFNNNIINQKHNKIFNQTVLEFFQKYNLVFRLDDYCGSYYEKDDEKDNDICIDDIFKKILQLSKKN